MSGGRAELELRARDGRAVLVTRPDEHRDREFALPEDVVLPEQLAPALHEWAGVVDAVRRSGERDGPWGDLVSDRGRRLAGRLARCTGVPVRYVDPLSGLPEVLPAGDERETPPWATGLPVSAVTALIIGVALLALSHGLREAGPWIVLLGNVVVAAGLAPSIWLGRGIRVWRWVAYGAAAGILLTWLLFLLTPLP